MANLRTLQRSFAGGEMAPEMFGRVDDVRYQTGAARLRNFLGRPQGPVESRPGLKAVAAVKDSTKLVRLLPFVYSTDQTMVLEMGEEYFRFHTLGGTLLYATPAAYNPATAYVVGDMCESGGLNYYCIADVTGTAPPDTDYWYELPDTPNVYEIPTPYAETDLFSVHYVQSADVLTLVHPSYPPMELRRLGATQWVLLEIDFDAQVAAPTGFDVDIGAGGGSGEDTYYTVTAMGPDEIQESPPATASGGDVDHVQNDLYTTGNYNHIHWDAVAGATRYNVYKMSGGVYGYIGSVPAGTLSIDDYNIGPDFSKTPPVYNNDFVGAGNYPGAVSYFEQRRVFGGTLNEPQKIWMTRSGTESTMAYSLPIRDDDRIEFRIAARQANTIRHVVPLSELLLLTASTEWRVTSVNTDAITPTSISVRPQSYVGASAVQPLLINAAVVYEAARGGHLRQMGYDWRAAGYVTYDLSIRAPHLFDEQILVDMAYTQAPYPVIWAVSSSGILISLTYVPEEQINAVQWHDTEGTFESCAVVAEGVEDALYVIVRREINGGVSRFVERMENRAFATGEDWFGVDCGLSYDGWNDGATTATVSGGPPWDSSQELTITASTPIFAFPAQTDVGDVIVLEASDGGRYRLTIRETTSTTVAKAQVDRLLAAELQAVATTDWAFARNEMASLDHLEGETVSILADGAVHPQRVVTSGAVTLDRPAALVHIGLPYVSDLQTLPLALQIEAFAQGRQKAINHAWLRVLRSSGIWIGPDEDSLVEAKQRTTEPYGVPPALKSEEIRLLLPPTWTDAGQVYVRQEDPLPLTILGITLEVALGG